MRRKLHDRIHEHTYAARKHDNTSAIGEHYANTHLNTTTPNITFKILKRASDTLQTTHRGSLRHPNKIPTTKPTRRTPSNGLPHLTLTTYSTDNTPLTIHYTDNTLNWKTHSTGNTLYRQNALPITRPPTDSTVPRTRQQHLHPRNNLQSPVQSPLSLLCT